MLKKFLILFALCSPCGARSTGSMNGVPGQSIANVGATETAGAGGVTVNAFVAADTSSPTRFITAAASTCGSGVALSSATTGGAFTLSDPVGTVQVKTDSSGATAGHLLVASSTAPGLAMDSGQTPSLSISEETTVCGTALTTVSGGGLVTMNPRSRGSYGHKVDQMNGAAPPVSAVVVSTNAAGQMVAPSAQAANTVYANCTSSAGSPTFCAVTSAMVPNNAANTTGNAGTANALAAMPSVCSSGSAAVGVLANGNATGCAAYDAAGAAASAQTSAVATAEAYSSDASHLASNTVPVARLPVAAASGSGHAAGIVPDPGAAAGATKFLREDMTFAAPSGAVPNTQTAGAGGVTANYLVAEDTSNPVKFITAPAGTCGAGIAAATTAAGSTFTLQDLNSGSPINVAVDAGGVTAGDILIGSSTTAGAVHDSGKTSSATISNETFICGVAAATAAGGAAVSMFPRPRASRGVYIDQVANASIYTGLVATRTELATSFSSSNTWGMSRRFHVARQSIPANGLRPVYANWYVTSSNVETTGGTVVWNMSIEYPAGTIAGICTFSGNSTFTATAAQLVIPDRCPHAAIPSGATFWTRVLFTTSGGIYYAQTNTTGYYSSSKDGFLFGTGTPADDTLSGTVGTSSSNYGFSPVAIIGTTVLPSVCIVGDSRAQGIADKITDPSGDTGEETRAIGAVFAYTKLAIPSTTVQTALTNFTNRLQITAYCTHAIDQYGINDLKNSGRSAAQVGADRSSMATLLGKPTYGTTLPPETSSTDSWATTTNQTITQDPTAFNAIALTPQGIPGELGVLDVASVFNSLLTPTDVNKWPVSYLPGLSSGTVPCTTDGIHEVASCNGLIAKSGVVNTNWVSRR